MKGYSGMFRAPFAPPAIRFAEATGGRLRGSNHNGEEVVYPDGSFVYLSIRGRVRLARPGHITVELGGWDDPTEKLARAYQRAVS